MVLLLIVTFAALPAIAMASLVTGRGARPSRVWLPTMLSRNTSLVLERKIGTLFTAMSP